MIVIRTGIGTMMPGDRMTQRAAPGADWAAEESYDERDRRGDERYAPPARRAV